MACYFFNEIIFQKKKIDVNKLKINEEKKKILEENTLIFFTGVSRKANLIEKEKIMKFQIKKNYYNEILSICKEAKKIFLSNDKSKFLSTGDWFRKNSFFTKLNP